MSIAENHERFCYTAAYDVFAVRRLGYLKGLPIAVAETREEPNWAPQVFVGQGRLPISKADPHAFVAAFALRPIREDGAMHVEYSANEVLLVDHQVGASPELCWGDRLRRALHLCLKRCGLMDSGADGVFQISLRRLVLLGPGASVRLESFPPCTGMFGTILVDLPMKYTGGEITIHNPEEGESYKSFDFSTGEGNDISFLHWFYDSAAMIECVTTGVRAFLVYDVVIDPMKGYPLMLYPDAEPTRHLEAQIRSLVPHRSFRDFGPKCPHYLPLVRLLTRSYRVAAAIVARRSGHGHTDATNKKEKEMDIPFSCLELCMRVVGSYEDKVRKAASHFEPVTDSEDKYEGRSAGRLRDVSAVLSIDIDGIRREGQDLLWSLGGKREAKRLLGRRCIEELDKVILQLDPAGNPFV